MPVRLDVAGTENVAMAAGMRSKAKAMGKLPKPNVRASVLDPTPRLYCVKKKRELHAVREMRAGPSKPLCREKLQTATSCCGTMAMVVNVVVKRRG